MQTAREVTPTLLETLTGLGEDDGAPHLQRRAAGTQDSSHRAAAPSDSTITSPKSGESNRFFGHSDTLPLYLEKDQHKLMGNNVVKRNSINQATVFSLPQLFYPKKKNKINHYHLISSWALFKIFHCLDSPRTMKGVHVNPSLEIWLRNSQFPSETTVFGPNTTCPLPPGQTSRHKGELIHELGTDLRFLNLWNKKLSQKSKNTSIWHHLITKRFASWMQVGALINPQSTVQLSNTFVSSQKSSGGFKSEDTEVLLA